jgi:hypothetical protein
MYFFEFNDNIVLSEEPLGFCYVVRQELPYGLTWADGKILLSPTGEVIAFNIGDEWVSKMYAHFNEFTLKISTRPEPTYYVMVGSEKNGWVVQYFSTYFDYLHLVGETEPIPFQEAVAMASDWVMEVVTNQSIEKDVNVIPCPF